MPATAQTALRRIGRVVSNVDGGGSFQAAVDLNRGLVPEQASIASECDSFAGVGDAADRADIFHVQSESRATLSGVLQARQVGDRPSSFRPARREVRSIALPGREAEFGEPDDIEQSENQQGEVHRVL